MQFEWKDLHGKKGELRFSMDVGKVGDFSVVQLWFAEQDGTLLLLDEKIIKDDIAKLLADATF